MGKEKRMRFETVAAKRAQKALDAIESLSKCANRTNYEYNEADVRKLLKVIREKVAILELAFKQQGSKGQNEFKF